MERVLISELTTAVANALWHPRVDLELAIKLKTPAAEWPEKIIEHIDDPDDGQAGVVIIELTNGQRFEMQITRMPENVTRTD